MNLCLYEPEHGFYMKNTPIGREGAFTTSPEISQLFGEMIGLWVIQQWQDLGSPPNFFLLELGPGRGTLMQDLLRVLKGNPSLFQAIRVHLVEISARLEEIQKEYLSEAPITWHHTVEQALGDCQHTPTIIIANEFFDALPIRQFIHQEEQVFEKVVSLDQNQLVFSQVPVTEPKKSPIKGIEEINPLMQVVGLQIANHLKKFTGSCLIIDYGYYETQYRDTFQALYQHSYSNPLEKCGETDLTAHVNFKALANQLGEAGIKELTFMTQKEFLESMGSKVRLAHLLSQESDPEKKKDLCTGYERITEEMGQLFKVLEGKCNPR